MSAGVVVIMDEPCFMYTQDLLDGFHFLHLSHSRQMVLDKRRIRGH